MKVRAVLVFNDYCHVEGGASRVAIDEAVGLQRSGLDVTYVGAVGPISADLTTAGVRTVCLEQTDLASAAQKPWAITQALWNQTAYRTTQSLLAALDRRYTVVHLHGYTKALTAVPALAASRAGFSTVCTLHDFFAACPNGAFFDYRRQMPCNLSALSTTCALTHCDKRHPIHKAYRIARGLAQRHAARFPSSVHDYITLSHRSAELLRPYLPDRARFHALSNVIDVSRASPVDVAANQALMVVGRLDAEKGVMLAAVAACRSNRPIVFVGDGPLRREVEATGAHVTGWLARDRVLEMVERARAVIFPSLWYETFGLVVTEAAARGVPALVSDVSAPAERIIHGRNGWIFRSGDLDDLVRCLAMTEDSDTVRAIGLAAYREYWAEPSDSARHTERLIAIYDTVIADIGG